MYVKLYNRHADFIITILLILSYYYSAGLIALRIKISVDSQAWHLLASTFLRASSSPLSSLLTATREPHGFCVCVRDVPPFQNSILVPTNSLLSKRNNPLVLLFNVLFLGKPPLLSTVRSPSDTLSYNIVFFVFSVFCTI